MCVPGRGTCFIQGIALSCPLLPTNPASVGRALNSGSRILARSAHTRRASALLLTVTLLLWTHAVQYLDGMEYWRPISGTMEEVPQVQAYKEQVTKFTGA